MKPERIYLSTIASDAVTAARKYGFGLEIAEYCTAWNMDEKFAETDGVVRNQLQDISCSTLHAPYNELFPCAIDKKARELAASRYRQAIDLAKGYGASKVIIHSGYYERMYYPVWFVEQSILFWKDFFREDPGVEILLENVFETEPQWLLDIVGAVDHPRLKLCLDVGHVNAYSPVPVQDWLEIWGSHIGHFHIHNNDGRQDRHSALYDGSIAMKEFLLRTEDLCPEATITLELLQCRDSVQWMVEEGLLD